jgi:hypothetical protein
MYDVGFPRDLSAAWICFRSLSAVFRYVGHLPRAVQELRRPVTSYAYPSTHHLVDDLGFEKVVRILEEHQQVEVGQSPLLVFDGPHVGRTLEDLVKPPCCLRVSVNMSLSLAYGRLAGVRWNHFRERLYF